MKPRPSAIEITVMIGVFMWVLMRSDPVALADEATSIATLIRHWESRQTKIRRVKWVVNARRFVPKGVYSFIDGRELPPKDSTLENTYTLWLDFERNLARQEIQGFRFNSDVGRHVAVHEIHLCNGTDFQEYRPLITNPDPDPHPGKKRYQCELYQRTRESYNGQMFFAQELQPLFAAHGVISTAKIHFRPIPLIPSDLGAAFEDYRLLPYDQTDDLLRLRSPNLRPNKEVYYEFIVDPTKEAAIVQKTLWSAGAIVAEQKIEYQQTAVGWMPAAWTFVKRSGRKLTTSDEIRVVEFDPDANLKAVRFHVKPTPGMFVYDEATDRTFQKAKPGKPDVDGPEAVRRLRSQEADRASTATQFVLIVANVAVVIALGVVFWIKKRKNRVKGKT